MLMSIAGPIAPDGIVPLCDRVRSVLRTRPHARVICDVGAIDDPDAVTVEALARMQLTALQLGGEIVLRDPCADLARLLDLCGLADVVPLEPC
ncbi:MAG TPA: STAS domain-containing protein [Actinomycetota bacterium]